MAEIDFMKFGAATLDGKASIVLPTGETSLVADDGRVISVEYREGSAGSIVRVRDIASGKILIELGRQENVGSVVLRADSLFFTGHAASATSVDPGIFRAELADGTVTSLIEAGSLQPDWGLAVRVLTMSPSGETLASSLCNETRCRIDVIDVKSGEVRLGVVELEGFLANTTDRVAIAGEQLVVSGFDLTTGNKLWSLADGEYQSSYLTTDGHLIQAYNAWLPDAPPTFTVAKIDTLTGQAVVLYSEPDSERDVSLWVEVSGDRFAVLGPGGSIGASFAQGDIDARADLLDLESGDVTRDAVVIEPPK